MSYIKKKYGIVIFALAGLAAASIGICQNTPGVFYTSVSKDLNVMRGTFAFHATFSMLAIAVTSLFLPKIMKKISFRKMIMIGSCLMIISTIGMSAATNVLQFYLLAVFRGIGASLCANVPITILINRWFFKSNGTATSIALSFSGIAGAVCSPLLAWCIEHAGWQNGYLLQAGMILLFVLPAMTLPFSDDPNKEGLLPYGGHSSTSSPQIHSKQIFCFTSTAFFALSLFCLLHTSITGISQHLSGMAVNAGMTTETGSLLLSAAMIGNIFTKLLIGILSDHIGPIKSSILMIIANAISMLLLYLGLTTGTFLMTLMGSFLFGSVYSVGAVGIALITKSLFGGERFSLIYPKISFLVSVGSSLSLPLIGYVYDFTGSYLSALAAALIFDMIDICLLLFTVFQCRRHTL
jgi:Sugar phosphate permease